MAYKKDVSRIRAQLVRVVKEGDEAGARSLIPQLGAGPRQIRAVLEEMLEDSDSLTRQAAAFGLGELGGAPSVKRLEQQLAIEEARGDLDGAAVIEDITRALGRIKDNNARASLVRRLERLAHGTPERADVNELACVLWKQRHPDLLPAVRRSLETLSLPEPHGLHGLLVLLERSPTDLDSWARDPAVSICHKTRALSVLAEDVPDALVPVLPAFISAAEALSEQTLKQDREAFYLCDSLFRLLLRHRERIFTTLPKTTREALRTTARKVITSTLPNPSTQAALVLEIVGRSEDAAFLEAHSPEYPVLAKVFHDAARVLRNLH
jgi:HEAT repeat protein